MFNWMKRHKKYVQRLGGVEEKMKSISAKRDAAASVHRQMDLMRVGGERRDSDHCPGVFMPERRSA